MIKILIKNPKRFIRLRKVFLIGRIFSFHTPSLKDIKDDSLYADIIAKLRYGDATGKDTRVGRFDDLDKVLDLLPDQGLLVHDVGCSSGVTSLDLMRMLNLKNKKYTLTISDRFLELFVFGEGVKYLYDSDENLRQIYFGRVLCDGQLSRVFFLSRVLFRVLSKVSRRDVQSKIVKNISLLDPKVQRCINSGELNAKSYNIFNRDDDNRYDFVRCMNLLNRSYFSDDQIKIGVANLIEATKHKGYLQIGRTDIHGVNKVSVFQKEKRELSLVLQFNGGAEIEDLVERKFLV